jgi:signal transduction histidine kinase
MNDSSRKALVRHAPSGRMLEAADRLASLGTLVAGVAHEINNPVTYVLANLTELDSLCGALRESLLGYRSALQQALGDAATPRIADLEAKIAAAGGLEIMDELLADAHEGAARIRDVVRDLLSLARPSTMANESIGIHDLLDSTLRLVHRERTQAAELDRDYGAAGTAIGDRAKLGQVFLNLISNAIHACADCQDGEQRIVVRTRDTADGIEIEVEDSGTGIPAELEVEIFTPFFTTKDERGTGLGLFISRDIIEQHHGTLDFRRRPGGGTIFRVTLPRTTEDRDGDTSDRASGSRNQAQHRPG